MSFIRRRITRRSISSFCSPAPRVPIPAPVRLNFLPIPVNRGNLYSRVANCTCNIPSRDLARRANMSRISMVRSIILTSILSSKLRNCTGVNSVLKTTKSGSISSTRCCNSCSLPLPMQVALSGFSRDCVSTTITRPPAASTRAFISLIEASTSIFCFFLFITTSRIFSSDSSWFILKSPILLIVGYIIHYSKAFPFRQLSL